MTEVCGVFLCVSERSFENRAQQQQPQQPTDTVITEGEYAGLTRSSVGSLTCKRCHNNGLGHLWWEGECKWAAQHVKTHWLRTYLGPVYDYSAFVSSIDWDKLESWKKFEGRLKMPQCGADMPAFITELLSGTRIRGYGSFEIQYVLDAVMRNIANGHTGDSDVHGVTSQAILDAVYKAEILTDAEFSRFKQLFENRLPIIVPNLERFNGTADCRGKWYTLNSLAVVQLCKPWHDIFDDYLNQSNWRLKWTPPALASAEKRKLDDNDNDNEEKDEKKRKVDSTEAAVAVAEVPATQAIEETQAE